MLQFTRLVDPHSPVRIARLVSAVIALFALGGRLVIFDAAAQPTPVPLPGFWRLDGKVNAIAVKDPLAYIGGDFGYVGPVNGPAGEFLLPAGEPNGDFPVLVGAIVAAVGDADGGWYVGGAFTTLDGQFTNLVHVLPDHTVDSAFRPNPDGPVRALLLSTTNLFVGGNFQNIAGSPRLGLVSLDPIFAGTNDWQVTVSGPVVTFALAGDRLYLGGQFATVNEEIRLKAAAVHLNTGALLDWNPSGATGAGVSAAGQVKTIAPTPTAIYVGGDFSIFGGRPRRGLASVDVDAGNAFLWDPRPATSGTATPSIDAIAVSGDTVYVGGEFTSIGGRNQMRIAALSGITGIALSDWVGGANGEVFTVTLTGGELMVGGRFTQIANSDRTSFAWLSATNGAAIDRGPNVSSLRPRPLSPATAPTVLVASLNGSKGLVGGDFISFGGALRSRLAAIDTQTGKATSWNPGADQEVLTLALSTNVIYVGGNFASIGGQPRARLAAINYTDGQATPWDAHWTSDTGAVAALAVTNGKVYVGGLFTELGGTNRVNLAELDAVTGEATSWDPAPNARVNALLVSSNTVYVGGQFTRILGVGTRPFISALSFGTNGVATLVTNFNALADGAVTTLVLDGARLYVGGTFNSIAGQGRKALAAIDPSTGRETDPIWDTGIIGTAGIGVRAILPTGYSVYAGGTFNAIGGEFRNRLAWLSASTGSTAEWSPDPDGPVNAIGWARGLVMVGGEFVHFGTNVPPATIGPFGFFAVFDGRPVFDNIQVSTNGTTTLTVNDRGDGQEVQVQVSDSLELPTWRTIDTFEIIGTPMQVVDPEPATNRRVYRMLRTPQ